MLVPEGETPHYKDIHSKYPIDLNESVYRSNAYLRYTFKFLADHFLKDWKKHQIEKVAESMRDKTPLQAARIINKNIGTKRVLFYYGPGDEDTTPAPERPVIVPKKKKKKKKTTTKKKVAPAEGSTQNALEENLKKSTKGA